jgi:hypothetical protein
LPRMIAGVKFTDGVAVRRHCTTAPPHQPFPAIAPSCLVKDIVPLARVDRRNIDWIGKRMREAV